jgi:hypothetical protein
MNKTNKTSDRLKKQTAIEEKTSLPGYPLYPASEDIYSHFRNQDDLDPEDVSKIKDFDETDTAGTYNEKDFRDDVSGSDLDVPGSELDDPQENVGNEDEENNYYSLGGDGHTTLDEENG